MEFGRSQTSKYVESTLILCIAVLLPLFIPNLSLLETLYWGVGLILFATYLIWETMTQSYRIKGDQLRFRTDFYVWKSLNLKEIKSLSLTRNPKGGKFLTLETPTRSLDIFVGRWEAETVLKFLSEIRSRNPHLAFSEEMETALSFYPEKIYEAELLIEEADTKQAYKYLARTGVLLGIVFLLMFLGETYGWYDNKVFQFIVQNLFDAAKN